MTQSEKMRRRDIARSWITPIQDGPFAYDLDKLRLDPLATLEGMTTEQINLLIAVAKGSYNRGCDETRTWFRNFRASQGIRRSNAKLTLIQGGAA